MKRLATASVVVSALLAGACNAPPSRPNFIGSKHSGNDDGDSNPSIGDDIKDGQDADSYDLLNCDDPQTYRGLRGWRRLSTIELKNTVSDIFGLTDINYGLFPTDIPKKELYDTVQVSVNFVDTARFKIYQSFAQEVSEKIDLSKFLPCTSNTSSCLSQKLPALLESAWRRPATEDEVKTLVALNDSLAKDGITGEDAVRMIVQAVVLSHNFLYRSELGTMDDQGNFVLTDYELASALSYMLWRTAPGADLRKAAASGELSKDGAMKVWATKMLADAKAKSAFKDFARMWFDSGKIERTVKTDATYTDAVKAKMVQEIGDTFSHVMFDAKDNTFQALMTGTFTMADPLLDTYYNARSESGKTAYAEPQRLGLLGQVGFLSSHAASDNPNPILRGVYVAEHTLCVDFTTPPPFTPPEVQPGLTNKELFKQHNKPGCSSCHTLIDNIGFAFENFDQFGRFRTIDAGQTIVVDSVLPVDGKEIPVKTPQEFFTTIANSNQAMQCFVRESFRYAYGRSENYARPVYGGKSDSKETTQGKLDRCQIESATAKLAAANGDIKTLMIELLSSPGYRIRLVGQAKE